MKKNYFFLIILSFALLLMNSCSEEIDISDEEAQSSIKLKSWEIAKPNNSYYSLGFSYDITKGFINNKAVKLPVVNVDKFIETNPRKFLIDKASFGTTKFFAEANAEDFTREYSKECKIDRDAKFPIKGVTIDANLKFEADVKTISSYSSKYSYARIELLRVLHQVKLTANTVELQNYLEDTFCSDVEKLNADQIINKYGTHVLLNMTVGGKLDFDYRAEFYSTTNTIEKKKLVSAGVRVTFLSFGGGSQYSVTSEEKAALKNNTGDWELLVTYCGGNNSGVTSISFNPETGYPTPVFSPKAWEESVKEDNAYLIDIEWEESYPIYEFIKNVDKRKEVIKSFNDYINKAEKVKSVELTPLYRLFNNGDKNSFYTNDLNEANNYINKRGYYFDYGTPPRSHIQGYVFKTQQPNTTPLYRLFNNGDKNSFYTNDLNEANNYINRRGYYFDYGSPERSYIQGYVFKTRQSNTTPLYRLFNNGDKNSFYTNDLEEANYYINKRGYYFDYGSPERSYIQGYVIPSQKK